MPFNALSNRFLRYQDNGMRSLTKNSCDMFLIITSFATEWSFFLVKYMLPVDGANASGLVIEGYIVIVGIMQET